MIAFYVSLILAVVLMVMAAIRLARAGAIDLPVKATFCAATLLAIAGIVATPYVDVWQKGMAGQAQMAEAEANRQILVREAQAKLDASTMLAAAEVERARGVAEANKIVADGLGGPEGYLRYLYIESLKDARGDGAQVIFVPTEAGLPILEAQRLKK
ncbi:hypothetical protein [Delftia lacustris]|uniref:hypothetical protein n=1 Tax=Delftia lacustris TaxID=558537 RepID=UPI0035A6CCEF